MNMRRHFELSMLKLLNEKSIDQITVNEIICEVGSCKGTFYKYFMDKYDLCYYCIKNYIYSGISFDLEDWETFISQYIGAFERNSKIIINAFISNDLHSARYYNEKMLTDVLSKFVARGGVDVTDKFYKCVLDSCGVFITSVVYNWMKENQLTSKEELVRCIRYIMPHSIYGYVYKD